VAHDLELGRALPPRASGTVTRVTAVEGPSRRVVLTGALAVALAGVTGCTSDRAPTDTGPSPDRRTLTVDPEPARDDGDVARVVRAIAGEDKLLRYCTAMEKRHRSSRGILRPLAARQRAHVTELRDILVDDPAEPPTVSPRVPANERAAIRELEGLLATARDERLDDCLAVSSGLLARLLASAAASHACTLTLVKERRERR